MNKNFWILFSKTRDHIQHICIGIADFVEARNIMNRSNSFCIVFFAFFYSTVREKIVKKPLAPARREQNARSARSKWRAAERVRAAEIVRARNGLLSNA